MNQHVLDYSSYKEILNEAFLLKDTEKVVSLIEDYLTKHVGKLYFLPGVEHFEKEKQDLYGLVFIHTSGKSMRFNWKTDKIKSLDIHSIDFYKNFKELNAMTPSYTFFIEGFNIVQILGEVVDIFNKKLGDGVDESLLEAQLGRPKLNKGTKDTKSSTSKEEEQLDGIEYADPKTIFDDLAGFVTMVVQGIQPSLIVAGAAGVGKCRSYDSYNDIEINEDFYNEYIKDKYECEILDI